MAKQPKPPLGKANTAMSKAAGKDLSKALGTVKGGAHGNPADKRARTRGAATQKAIKDQNK